MKDFDTYKLADMYGAVRGEIVLGDTLITESTKLPGDEFIEEGLVDTLGITSARLLMKLVKNEIPVGMDSKAIEDKAEQVLAHIAKTVPNTMVQRTLTDYADVKATSRATALYQMLVDL